MSHDGPLPAQEGVGVPLLLSALAGASLTSRLANNSKKRMFGCRWFRIRFASFCPATARQ
jgi:hypothetical protein